MEYKLFIKDTPTINQERIRNTILSQDETKDLVFCIGQIVAIKSQEHERLYSYSAVKEQTKRLVANRTDIHQFFRIVPENIKKCNLILSSGSIVECVTSDNFNVNTVLSNETAIIDEVIFTHENHQFTYTSEPSFITESYSELQPIIERFNSIVIENER